MTNLTESEFTFLASRTRLEKRARHLARLVLVDGVRATDAARQVGISRQRANGILNRFRGLRADGTPADWQSVTVVVRPETADLIYKLEAQDRRLLAAGKGKP